MTPLESALQAAQLHGFSVFPISRTKLPAIRSPHRDGSGPKGCRGECGQLGHGVHDASADVDRIRTMFDVAPWATGYGIACGQAPHHMIGLDLDRKNGADGVWELRKLAAQHGFSVPQTVIIRTPSNGFHAWWTGPADVKVPNTAGKVGPGIDVRGSGGYLIGPGSQTQKGQYVLATAPDNVVVRPVPQELLQLLLPKEKPAAPRRVLQATPTGTYRGLLGLVQTVLDAPDGELNNRLFWASCKAFEHAREGRVDALSIAGALQEAACVGGHPERPARRTINSAHKNVTGVDLWTP